MADHENGDKGRRHEGHRGDDGTARQPRYAADAVARGAAAAEGDADAHQKAAQGDCPGGYIGLQWQRRAGQQRNGNWRGDRTLWAG